MALFEAVNLGKTQIKFRPAQYVLEGLRKNYFDIKSKSTIVYYVLLCYRLLSFEPES